MGRGLAEAWQGSVRELCLPPSSLEVEVKRCGWPLVPDFAGTAHAYCGSTLPKAKGDLLTWHGNCNFEDM